MNETLNLPQNGTELKRRRDDAGVRANLIARRLGISEKTVSFYENDLRDVTPEFAQRYCDAVVAIAEERLNRARAGLPEGADQEPVAA